MKLKGIGVVAVAALGAAVLYYLWRKYQQAAPANRTNADLLNTPLPVDGGTGVTVTPPDAIYVTPIRLWQ